MAYVILVFFLILMICIALSGHRRVRESAIQSYLIVFGLTAIITELLSIINQITIKGVLNAWLCLIGIAIGWFVYLVFSGKSLNYKDLNLKLPAIPKTSWIDKVILLSIVIILILTFVTAVLAPPNTYDSMTYHMARVANWIQQQSIKYYPTAIERQNYSMPLAEYMILHLQVLSKSDLYANLVQWSGFLIAIITVTEIARFFRVSQTGQLLAALFTATLPMAILQSTSTQNDLVSGVFCLIFGYYLLQIIRTFNWKTALLTGLAMGLALLTKGTAYIYCAGIGLSLGGFGLLNNKGINRIKLFRGFVVLILFALLLNAGVYSRNTITYSHPLSNETGRITNDKFNPGVLYANLIRNGAMHIAIPIPHLNDRLTSTITNLLGDKISDPVSTFPGSDFKIQFLLNEDEAGNLLHFMLLSLSIVIVPWISKSENKLIALYAGGVAVCTILYSLIFKWQPWGNRLQLPIFLLGAPIVGYGLDRIKIYKFIIVLGVLGFSLYSLPYLTLNSTRPLVPIFKKGSPLRSNHVKKFFSDRPDLYKEYAKLITPFYKNHSVLRTDRMDQYFAGNSSNLKDYQNVMAAVNQIDAETIGLHLGTNHWEYPIWVFANKHASFGSPLFTHIGVVSSSKVLVDDGAELPRYIISTKFKEDQLIENKIYSIVIDTPSITLLER